MGRKNLSAIPWSPLNLSVVCKAAAKSLLMSCLACLEEPPTSPGTKSILLHQGQVDNTRAIGLLASQFSDSKATRFLSFSDSPVTFNRLEAVQNWMSCHVNNSLYASLLLMISISLGSCKPQCIRCGLLLLLVYVSVLGLPDLPYFTGDPVFQHRSPASRKPRRKPSGRPSLPYLTTGWQIGRMTAFDYLYILILIMVHCFGFQMWLFHSL